MNTKTAEVTLFVTLINEIKDEKNEKKLEKLMGKTYFTNLNSSIESSDGKHHNDHRGYGVFDFETHGPRSHRV
jgi:hypothetical protein